MKKTFFLLILMLAKVCSATCGTTGTTFWEDWNSGADPVWSGGWSVGHQTWLVATGSGESLTSSPPGSGWQCTNALKLATGGTATSLRAIGTVPYIPSGSTWTVNIEFAYDSTTVNGFAHVIDFNTPSGGTAAFYLETSSSGSGNFYINGATSVSISANAHHTLTITDTSGSTCGFKVDGGSTTSFTCVAADFNSILLTGGTSTANFYVGDINLSVTDHSGGFPPSQLTDMGGLTNGTTVTAAALTSSTHCPMGGTSNNAITYTAGSSTDSLEGSNSVTIPFPTSLSVCATSYAGNTGLSLQHNVPSTATPGAEAKINFETAYPTVSVGFYWYVHSASQYPRFDQAAFGPGGWFLTQCWSTVTNNCTGTTGFLYDNLCIEQYSTGTVIACTQVSDANWVWVTGNWTTTGGSTGDTVNVYSVNQTTGALGSLLATWNPIDSNFSPGTGSYFLLGAGGGEVPGVQVSSYYSNIILEYAHAAFPVLPPTASYNGARTTGIF